MPSTLNVSGNFPAYLPETINGLPDDRSGRFIGYNCNEETQQSQNHYVHISAKAKAGEEVESGHCTSRESRSPRELKHKSATMTEDA